MVTGESAAGKEQFVEVAHEALIRRWPRLSNWLDENRQDLLLHQGLTEASNQWHKLEHDPGALYRGVRLQQALELAIQHPEWITQAEREFLDASRENARKEAEQVHRLSRARRTQFILGGAAALLVIGLAVVVLAVNGFFAPRQMSGIFNVAVADFGEVGAEGQISASETGQQISAWAVNYLRETLQDDANVQIWPNQGGLFDRTTVGLVTPADAPKTAGDIHADLIFYGSIDTVHSPAQLTLGFYVPPQFDSPLKEIQGNHSVGRPIRIADLANPAPSVQPELKKQTSVIAWLTLGLTQVQLGNSEQALQDFNKAAEIDSQSPIAQFFIGRENLFLADRHPDQRETYRQAAEDAFQKAITLDNQYARAYIGLGSVYGDRAADLIDNALQSGRPVDARTNQLTEQAIQAYQKVLDLNPATADYGNPVVDVARMALGNAYRQQGTTAYLQGDNPAALKSLEQALAVLEDVRGAFEATVKEDESHRRYLTQVYEYLGETYQWQGLASEIAFDYPAAIQSYQQSLASFKLCNAQAENSPDQIVQDIVGRYCQPRTIEIQNLYDTLIGEQ